jgi:hypothetical protein
MKIHSVRAAIFVALLAAVASGAQPASTPSATAPKHFASPEAAADALVAAARSDDQTAMLAVLGSDAKPILQSGDAVADNEVRERFVSEYEAAHAFKTTSAGKSELVIGKDEWPFPVPLVKESAGWRFDIAAGETEILDRRVGRNERFTIQTCLAIVDAQRDYYIRNPNKDPLLHYARRFASSEGKRDGLYFPTAEDEPESPLGSLVAQARAEGYTKATPFHGYFYRMLEAQGPNARDGAYDYVAKGHMIGGFAVVAYPAIYDNSGVMTFIVNQDGVVYQKDLGADTQKLAGAIERFDPDESWERVPEQDQELEETAAAD